MRNRSCKRSFQNFNLVFIHLGNPVAKGEMELKLQEFENQVKGTEKRYCPQVFGAHVVSRESLGNRFSRIT
jgi:hypothetical protein